MANRRYSDVNPSKGEGRPSPSQYPKSKGDPASNPTKFPQHNSESGWSQAERSQKHSVKGSIGQSKSK